MLGITGTSLRVDAGHIMTTREHVCGEFRDTDNITANALGVGPDAAGGRSHTTDGFCPE